MFFRPSGPDTRAIPFPIPFGDLKLQVKALAKKSCIAANLLGVDDDSEYRFEQKSLAKFSDTCSVRDDGLCMCIGSPRLVGGRKAGNSNMQEFFCTTLYIVHSNSTCVMLVAYSCKNCIRPFTL